MLLELKLSYPIVILSFIKIIIEIIMKFRVNVGAIYKYGITR